MMIFHRNSSQSSKIFGSNNNADETNATNAEEGGDKKRERGKVHDDETEETTYRYSVSTIRDHLHDL